MNSFRSAILMLGCTLCFSGENSILPQYQLIESKEEVLTQVDRVLKDLSPALEVHLAPTKHHQNRTLIIPAYTVQHAVEVTVE